MAALLLKQAGHEVVGITMSIWKDNPQFKACAGDACFSPDEKKDIAQAQELADILEIPYHVLDCADQYQKIVLDYFKSEYLAGRTPNPCVFCNSQVKFGTLIELARASGLVFDQFATGHYSNLTSVVTLSESNKHEVRRYVLKKAADIQKDQTYFLYRLKQEQLAQVIFPLGGLTKTEVRKIAKDNNLPVSAKPDSQDFYSGDYNDLIGIPDKPGNIVDTQGKVLGTHNGYWHYTIGQRKGLGIAAESPLYVLELDACKNEVIVGCEAETLCSGLIADDLNWLISEQPEKMSAMVKIRSAQKEFPAEIIPKNNGIEVKFASPQKAVTKGQSVVVYQGDYVAGGGVITTPLSAVG
ncbi:tRNA-specific 2-thiouridylase MnmA [Candidatus Termititenax dinenymphae]|uniref:tRNA-uridine 2-sulfurtransferase n=1 Tax=Candidatus Termititenax dinenymphae TaxID=2218523 RepID=A0A388TKT5_9BACT|nr:tRNA-specific 2-thiouridylase MnmA [Candidatus Termititenax dinenymphae]